MSVALPKDPASGSSNGWLGSNAPGRNCGGSAPPVAASASPRSSSHSSAVVNSAAAPATGAQHAPPAAPGPVAAGAGPAADSGGDSPVDLAAIQEAVRTILRAVGEDPTRDGLLETPRRVAKMYAEMFAGLHLDPARHLEVTFPEEYDELVLVRDIPFTSMCEHHLLPFSGVAHVGYLPNGRVTGLSKLARVVDEVARRPQVQERMTQTIADMIERSLGSAGVAVVIQAEHSCMSIRGVKKHGAKTVTSALRGVFKTNQSSRAEVMSLISGG